jgi:hypothetical protein
MGEATALGREKDLAAWTLERMPVVARRAVSLAADAKRLDMVGS